MATYTVTTAVDEFNGPGTISLREALFLANTNPGADVIRFDPGLLNDTILLTLGELLIIDDVVIDGDIDNDGSPDIRVNAQGTSGVFTVGDGTLGTPTEVTFDGLEITGGVADDGGGILAGEFTDVTVVSSRIFGNQANDDGGGIFTEGTLTIEDSSIDNNEAGQDGGGIFSEAGSVRITDSLVADNDAAGNGGGMIANGGEIAVINATVANNEANAGGGIYNDDGEVAIVQSTVTGNQANTSGAGVWSNDKLYVANSILAGNGNGPTYDDVSGAITARAGINLFSEFGLAAGSDITESDLTNIFENVDALNGGGLLSFNGGFFQSVAISPFGVAIDAGSNSAAFDPGADLRVNGGDTVLSTDVRGIGFDRIVDGTGLGVGIGIVDIGAFEVQNVAPIVDINTGITVDENNNDILDDGAYVIDSSELFTADPDNGTGERIYELVEIPEYGVLERNGVVLEEGDVFTQFAINNGRIEYIHDGSDSTEDSFVFNVTDPTGVGQFGEVFEITINPINDAPELIRNTGFAVQEGSSFTLSEFQLFGIDSEDGPEDLLFELTTLADPLVGQLTRGGAPINMGQTFSVQDVIDGLIAYEHTGLETAVDDDDEFTLALVDTNGAMPDDFPTDFTVQVGVVEQSDPVEFLTNSGLEVNEDAGPVAFSMGNLQYTDTDSPDTDIVYLITDAPDIGELTFLGAVLLEGSTFTQDDINNGRISFESDIEGPFDRFDFLVGNPGGPALSGSFFVTIRPTDDTPEFTGVLTYGLKEGTVGAITNEFLDVEDDDTGRNEIVYTIDSEPDYGFLSRLGVRLDNGDSFTQADVDNGFINYTHSGEEEFDDSIDFTISDGESSDSATLDINITPMNDLPELTVNADILVAEQQFDPWYAPIDPPFVIDNTMIEAEDEDEDDGPSDIVFTLTERPGYGKLYLDEIPLQVGSTFTQQDINDGLLNYRNDGSEIFEDAFSYTITNPGEPGFTSGSTRIVIDPVNDIPYITTNEAVHVVEGGEIVISTLDLETTDADDNPEDLVYIICDLPHCGILFLDGKPLKAHEPGSPLGFDHFTQADIDAGRITFQHNGDDDCLHDCFTFVVADKDWAYAPYDPHKFESAPPAEEPSDGPTVLDWFDRYGSITWWDWLDEEPTSEPQPSPDELPAIHKFDIHVTPANDGASLVVNTGFEVAEGGVEVLESFNLRATDSESGPDDVTYTIRQAPENGTLFMDGEILEEGDTFTQGDINARIIRYVHNGSDGGSDAIIVDVVDEEGAGQFNQAIFISIEGENDAPVMAANTGIKLGQGEIEIINPSELAAIDADNTDAEIVYTLTDLPENGDVKRGTVILELGDTFTQDDINNGLIGYDHNGSETEADSFQVIVRDFDGEGPATQTVAVQVVLDDPGQQNNESPVARDDRFFTGKDTAITGNLFANNGNGTDSDPDGVFLEVIEVEGIAALVDAQYTLPSGALLTINADGSIFYDPNGVFNFLAPNESASDGFGYTISDGEGGIDFGQVVVTAFGTEPQTGGNVPIISIEPLDAVVNEGNAGTVNSTFKVTRTGNLAETVTVAYQVSGISAFPAAASDFAGDVMPSGSVTLAVGQTEAIIAVPIDGDFALEQDENFQVKLTTVSALSGAGIDKDTAVGTIVNDDVDATAVLSAEADKDKGTDGADVIMGLAGKDKLSGGDGIDVIHGGAGNDKIRGDDGDDGLFGDSGADKIRGGDGNDFIDGGTENDKIDGNDGADVINGGAGFDIIKGGDDADTFVFGPGNETDLIKDFDADEDLLDFSDWGAVIDSRDDVLANATEQGKHLHIQVEGTDDLLILRKTDLEDLMGMGDDQFVF